MYTGRNGIPIPSIYYRKGTENGSKMPKLMDYLYYPAAVAGMIVCKIIPAK
ncbi:hypothetical protein [Niabella hirudinis]|uniref:hypothetical protein n=1 Tax=Niabella hirudinis TaxID=1285929 RepID=UPI003EBAD4A4